MKTNTAIPAAAAVMTALSLHSPAALVGYWAGDGNARDSISATSGGVSGSTAFGPGKLGQSFTFNGGSIVIPSGSALNFGTGDFSVAFWVSFNALGNGIAGIISKDTYDGGGAYNGWLFNDSADGLGMEVRNVPAVDSNARTPEGEFTTARWYHMAGVRQAGVLKLYVDGVLRTTVTEAFPANVTNSAPLRIGSLTPASPQSLSGSVDDVRLYSHALSAGDIAILASALDGDHDGILDEFETGTGTYLSPENTGTNAALADTDGDGISDGAEVNTYGTNPNAADTDGDGFQDGFEIQTGFDPKNAQSTPELLTTLRPAREFRFAAATGANYRIEGSTDTQNWTTIENNITGAGITVTRYYTEADLGPRYFLRVRRNE